MKTLVLIGAILGSSVYGFAQSSGNEDIAMIQNLYGMEKRKLVANYMQIPQSQAAAFWSVYEQCEVDRRELGRKRIELINEYAKTYKDLTDDKADEIAEGILENNVKLEKFHQSYYSKFKKATSAVTAAQFMQLELYLQSEIKREITSNVPFIGEIEKLRKD
jgi:hypothetical protein